MPDVRISVIIPTIGRETLAAAVESAAGADEIIVVFDEVALVGEMRKPKEHNSFVDVVSGGDHGYTARTRGMTHATGTHLAFLDDDDVFTPGAIAAMRASACDRPVIFRMDHPQHGILWRENIGLEFGNVGTPMILVPNIAEKLGVWAPHAHGFAEPGGDFTFISGCVRKMGSPVWREEIVARVRPPFSKRRTVSIVTPWIDHLELTSDYFAAVNTEHVDDLVIVDNASTPPLEFATLRLEENAGFSRGSNAGLERAVGDVVVFLNNDIEPGETGWLGTLVAAVEPGVLAGAKLRYDRHADVDGHSLPYLDGWCLAGMRADLLDLGGFDEAYAEPAYFSDNDLCLRARASGMRLREVNVPLRHKVNQTSGGSAVPAVQAATGANYERYAARAREILAPLLEESAA